MGTRCRSYYEERLIAAVAGGRVPLTCAERMRLQAQISMSLINLAECYFFWFPDERRLYARCTTRDASALFSPGRGRPAVPRGALYVGTYCQGIKSADVLEDLEGLIARHRTHLRAEEFEALAAALA